MNRFATGLIAGSLIGAVGLTCAMTDKKTRKMVTHDGKKMMNKANKMFNKMDLM